MEYLSSDMEQQQNQINKIKWIENGILENVLGDHRKYIIWRILSPYLLNVRKLQREEAYSVMKDWLDKCDKLERLNFYAKSKIREGLRGASKGYYPISLEKLKEENKTLYDIVTSNIVIKRINLFILFCHLRVSLNLLSLNERALS